MAANYFGHFLFTNLLLEKLKLSRVINVSSIAHYGGYPDHFDDINCKLRDYNRTIAYCDVS